MKNEFNITFFDLETTGKTPMGNEILTAFFRTREANTFKVVDECYLEFKPEKYREESFAIHGISREEAMTFPDKWESFEKLLKYMNKHKDSLFCCHANYCVFGRYGYFDKQVISSVCFEYSYSLYCLFEKAGFQFISTHTIAKKMLQLENYSEKNIAQHFGIIYDAHKSDKDFEAMEKIFRKIIRSDIRKDELIRLSDYDNKNIDLDLLRRAI